MKMFLKLGAPIAAVVGAVFGITFIQNYSPDDPQQDDPGGGQRKVAVKEPPLKFSVLRVAAVPPDSTAKHLQHLRYWDPEVESGGVGHFEFWCQNKGSQPVHVNIRDTNCQCASVEFTVAPPDALGEYLVLSALGGGPLTQAPGPGGAVAHVLLSKKLGWTPMFVSEFEKTEKTIPAASERTGPQFAIVRLNWKGKGETGPKSIGARVLSHIGDASPTQDSLEAEIVVVPTFDVLARVGTDTWVPTRALPHGELRENSVSRYTVYLVSATRPQVLYSVDLDRPDPCISFSEPVPASEQELQSARAYAANLPADAPAPLRRIKSLYKFEVTVRERVEVDEGGKKVIRQLDLGPLDRRMNVKAADGGHYSIALQGRVLGDITILAGAETGKIEMGNSFPADQDHSRVVGLLAERPGLDLSVLEAEVTPNYLKVKLEELPAAPDGAKQWRLRVTVPKGTVYGPLPLNSAVVLKTNSNTLRRLRLPVIGASSAPQGPRL
jgi:hypothetical protein